MTENDRLDVGGLWNGLSYVTLGLLGASVFVFYGDSVDTGGVVASVALVVIGIAAVLAPRISPLFAELDNHWTGLFWVLCGLGVFGLGVVSGSTGGRWINGVVLGGGVVIYGILVALGR